MRILNHRRLLAVFEVQRGRTESPRETLSNGYSSAAPSPEPLFHFPHLEYQEPMRAEIEVNEASLKANTPLLVRSSSDSALTPYQARATPPPDNHSNRSPEPEINHVLKGALDRTDDPPAKMSQVNFNLSLSHWDADAPPTKKPRGASGGNFFSESRTPVSASVALEEVNQDTLTRAVEFPGDWGPLGIHVIPYCSSLSGRTLGLHIKGIEENSRSKRENLFKQDESIVQINDTQLQDKTFSQYVPWSPTQISKKGETNEIRHEAQEVFRQAMTSSSPVRLEVLPLANKPRYEKSLIGQLFTGDAKDAPAKLKSPILLRAKTDSQPAPKRDAKPNTNLGVRRADPRTRTPEPHVANPPAELRPGPGSLERGSPSPSSRAESSSPPRTRSQSPQSSRSPLPGLGNLTGRKGGKKLKIDLKKVWVFRFRFQPRLKVSGFPPAFLHYPSKTHQSCSADPPFGLLTREIKGRVCLIRLAEKPPLGARRQSQATNPSEENRHLNGTEGLGFTVVTRDSSVHGPGPILVKNILQRGAAVKDGRLQPGDRILEVNGVDMTGRSQEELVAMLRSTRQGESVCVVVARQEDIFLPRELERMEIGGQLSPGAGQRSARSQMTLQQDRKSLTQQIFPGSAEGGLSWLKSLLKSYRLGLTERGEGVAEGSPPWGKSGPQGEDFREECEREWVKGVESDLWKGEMEGGEMEKGEEEGSLVLEDGREQLMYEIPLNESGSAGLGISLKGNKSRETGEDLGIFIKSIIHGGAANKSSSPSMLLPDLHRRTRRRRDECGAPDKLVWDQERLDSSSPKCLQKQLPTRIVRSPAGCETGFWDKIPHKRKKDTEEERLTQLRAQPDETSRCRGGNPGVPRDGRLSVNDQMIAVNGESLLGRSNHAAMETLRHSMSSEGNARGTIQLVVLRAPRQFLSLEALLDVEKHTASPAPNSNGSSAHPQYNSNNQVRAGDGPPQKQQPPPPSRSSSLLPTLRRRASEPLSLSHRQRYTQRPGDTHTRYTYGLNQKERSSGYTFGLAQKDSDDEGGYAHKDELRPTSQYEFGFVSHSQTLSGFPTNLNRESYHYGYTHRPDNAHTHKVRLARSRTPDPPHRRDSSQRYTENIRAMAGQIRGRDAAGGDGRADSRGHSAYQGPSRVPNTEPTIKGGLNPTMANNNNYVNSGSASFPAATTNGSYGHYGNEDEDYDDGFPPPPSPGSVEEMNRDLSQTPPRHRYLTHCTVSVEFQKERHENADDNRPRNRGSKSMDMVADESNMGSMVGQRNVSELSLLYSRPGQQAHSAQSSPS
ncbi:hypothetical protein NQZ68_002339 [Dissostichus eleginoides]|nr:hypothetical protein NQZ68_002339 [Dissostichus eleginoides]